ncbi:MAG: prepilin-type N-terminal cleavage/methylation domain-containing protein [Candidatus Pacebacteria bacterium]|nr:prepilin-type N-terminal cleavage/methylation domain-containing protein [Candidatus Paceibacterota bacterium]
MRTFFLKLNSRTNRKSINERQKGPKGNQRGFSLPELIVVIGIFVIISSVAMFNQGKLSSSVLLTNMAYEVGLAVREAQTYGIGVRSEDSTGTSFIGQYGVHFSVDDETSRRQVVVFADGVGGNDPNSTYDAGEEKYIYEFDNRRGNKIDGVCIGTLPVNTPCTSSLSNDGSSGYFTSADILFKRPNPAALVFSPSFSPAEPRSDRVYIIISSLAGDDCRAVIVESTGQIRVEDSSKGACQKTVTP